MEHAGCKEYYRPEGWNHPMLVVNVSAVPYLTHCHATPLDRPQRERSDGGWYMG
ncbi:MAG: hypothetical protein ACYTBX_10350 [Planctomycetota bacterium]|jgi:hypothetical protein